METKRCGHCGADKPLDDFWNDKSRADGKAHTCKKCMKEYQDAHKEQTARNGKAWYQNNIEHAKTKRREWKQNNQEKVRSDAKQYRTVNKEACNARSMDWVRNNRERHARTCRAYYLKTKFNITIEQFEILLLKQDCKCGVCKKPFGRGKICIDHCHNAGHVRGLLCSKCNSAEGMLGSIENVRRLLEYMMKNEIFYINSQVV